MAVLSSTRKENDAMHQSERRDTVAIISGLRKSKDAGTRSECRHDFLERFYPVLLNYFSGLKKRHRIKDMEEEDWAAEVVLKLVTRLEHMEKRIEVTDTFRSYVRKAAENAWKDSLRKHRREVTVDSEVLNAVIPESMPSEVTQEIEQMALLSKATDLLKQEGRFSQRDWQIFGMLTSEPVRSVNDIADQFAITRDAVYMVKCRMVSRLRKTIRQIEQEPE